jgi:hypothetical protein
MYRYANKGSVPCSILMFDVVCGDNFHCYRSELQSKGRSLQGRVCGGCGLGTTCERCSDGGERWEDGHPVCLHVEVYVLFPLRGGRSSLRRACPLPSTRVSRHFRRSKISKTKNSGNCSLLRRSDSLSTGI